MVHVFHLAAGRVKIERDPQAYLDVVIPNSQIARLNDWYKIIVNGKLMCRVYSFATAYQEAKAFAANMK